MDGQNREVEMGMSQCGQRASFNEANGTSDMDGKAARVAETEAGPRESKSRRVRTCTAAD
jgi:hypothetical protein